MSLSFISVLIHFARTDAWPGFNYRKHTCVGLEAARLLIFEFSPNLNTRVERTNVLLNPFSFDATKQAHGR